MRSSGCPGKEREERMCERAETNKRNGRNRQDLDQERRNRNGRDRGTGVSREEEGGAERKDLRENLSKDD